jgi:hypothetical protein
LKGENAMKKTFSLLLTAVLLSGLCLPAMAADYNNNYHEPGSQIYVTIPIHRDSGIWDFDGYFELTRGLEWVRTYTIPEKFLKKATSTTFYGTFIGVRENPDINPVKDIWLTVIVKIKENATPVQEFYCPAIWTCNSPNSSADTEATVTHFRFPIPVRPSLDHLLPGLPPDPPAGALPPVPKVKTFPNSNMCIMGLRLRDLAPKTTDKWYMLTPVDLSQDGEKTYPLVGSATYRLGTATVAVKEGRLTVNYETLKGVTVHSESLAVYPDLETAVKQNAANLGGVSLKPGEPISIADDLSGDTNVVLVMRNKVTFNTGIKGLSRFYPGAPDVRDVLKQMREMIR